MARWTAHHSHRAYQFTNLCLSSEKKKFRKQVGEYTYTFKHSYIISCWLFIVNPDECRGMDDCTEYEKPISHDPGYFYKLLMKAQIVLCYACLLWKSVHIQLLASGKNSNHAYYYFFLPTLRSRLTTTRIYHNTSIPQFLLTVEKSCTGSFDCEHIQSAPLKKEVHRSGFIAQENIRASFQYEVQTNTVFP